MAFTPGQAADLAEGRSVFVRKPAKGLVCAPRRRRRLSVPTTFISGILKMTSQEEIPKKGFIIGTIRLSAAGYLSKVENRTFIKTKETEYRWIGEIKMEERLPDRRPLYEIINLEEIVH